MKKSIYKYIKKVVISVSLDVRSLNHDRFASNFDWGTREPENHGNAIKKTKIVVQYQARVNGNSDYKQPGQRWVPQLVVRR